LKISSTAHRQAFGPMRVVAFPGSGGGFSPHKCEDFPPAKIPPNLGGKMKQNVPPFLRGSLNGDC
jgi:hypothetical protein